MAMKAELEEEINEKSLTFERENLMVPLTVDGIPTLRRAHFLKPSLNPQIQANPPSISPFENPNLIKFLQKRVVFKGRAIPLKYHWKNWVRDLQQTYEELWKKVGIFDAIRVSTYKVKRHNELVFGLAEKWCPETKSFIFPWGETTLTLEDIMILGGFPVVGRCVRNPFRGEGVEEIKTMLVEAGCRTREVGRNQVSHRGWLEYFKGKGGELEHVAFLVLWLSRYVFPTTFNCIVAKHAYGMAISLAKGIKIAIAIAPAILASIYRDLGLLKEKIVAFSRDGEDDGSELQLWASFQLVQVWAWERFPTLSPKPLPLVHGWPRMARWNHVRITSSVCHSLNDESAKDTFLWRPYAVKLENWEFPEFYSDEGMWVLINFEVKEGLLSFALCLRDCELVGFDCVEQYLPHRVGLQFGFDQDVPAAVPRLNADHELAWSSYAIPLVGYKFYIPARLLEGDVTIEYSRWWKPALAQHEDALLVYGRQRRSPKNLKSLSQILLTDLEEKAPPLSGGLCGEAKCLYSVGISKEVPVKDSVSCKDTASLSPASSMNPVLGEENSSRYDRAVALEEVKDKGVNGSNMSVFLQGSVEGIGAEAPLSSIFRREAMSACSMENSKAFPNEKSLACAHPVGKPEVKGKDLKGNNMNAGGGSKHFQMSYSGSEPLKAVCQPVISKIWKPMGLKTKKSGSVDTQREQTTSSEDVGMKQACSLPDVFLQGSVEGIGVEGLTVLSNFYNDAVSSNSVEYSKDLSKNLPFCERLASLSAESVMNPLVGLVDSVKCEHPIDNKEGKDLSKKKLPSCERLASLSAESVMNPLVGLVDSVKCEYPIDNEEGKDRKVNRSNIILDDGSKKLRRSYSGNESSKAVNEVGMSQKENPIGLNMKISGSMTTEIKQFTSTEDLDMKQADSSHDVEEQSYNRSPIEAIEQLQGRMNRLARLWSLYKEAKGLV